MYAVNGIRAIVWNCLDNFDYKNAIFIMERLCAEVETDENVHLLANSYYRANQVKKAYWLLKKQHSRSLLSRYLQALCAFDLQEFAAAEQILTDNKEIQEFDDFKEITGEFQDIACFVLQLLGKIYRKTERFNLACHAYHKALQLNPYLWQAYEELCIMGSDVCDADIFTLATMNSPGNESTLDGLSESSKLHTPKNNLTSVLNSVCTHCSTPLNSEAAKGNDINESGFDLLVEQFSSLTSISPVPIVSHPPNNINEKKDCAERNESTEIKNQSTENIKTRPYAFGRTVNMPTKKVNERPLQIQRPITNSAAHAAKENKQTTRKPKLRSPIKVRETATPKILKDNTVVKMQIASAPKEKSKPVSVTPKLAATDDFMALFRFYATGVKLLHKYQCKKAIEHFEQGSFKNQLKAPSVQSLIAKCHYELDNYGKAADIFRRVHEDEPFRFENMDTYSSCLWKLGHKMELSSLAQDLVKYDKLSPITWCAVGNLFSLEKDHETAIKMIKRANQIDADYAYGYALLGHEYVLLDDLDKARSCFNLAIARDRRQYAAWFGIGTTYAKESKHRLAEIYYQKALKINTSSSVIHVHIAAMQHLQGYLNEALDSLQHATKFAPDNLIAKLLRAKIFYDLNRYEEALCELDKLKALAPEEISVFRLLGMVHKAMGHEVLAVVHNSWSTDMYTVEPLTPLQQLIFSEFS